MDDEARHCGQVAAEFMSPILTEQSCGDDEDDAKLLRAVTGFVARERAAAREEGRREEREKASRLHDAVAKMASIRTTWGPMMSEAECNQMGRFIESTGAVEDAWRAATPSPAKGGGA
jgi:hypothetical protein